MSFLRGLYLSAGVCLVVTVSHAQSTDTLTGKLANFPSRLFGKIQSQSTSLNQQLTSQTQQYLARMARREQRMQQRLSAVDSNAAKALFANSQQQYAALAAQIKSDTGGRPVVLRGQYVPSLDTLQGAMAFLQQHVQSLTSSSAAKLQGAASQFRALQAKMQDADIVKAYVQSRQQQISQFIAQHSNFSAVLSKPLARVQAEQYYYSQRVQQLKAMWADPTALAQQALSMLSKLSAFQNFMMTHSQLGSLFHVPNSYGSAAALNGLQTKEQIAQTVQQHISAAGPGGAAALQGSLQSAQSQLDGLKDKLSKFGAGSADVPMPAFTPNTEKTKTFLHRLQVGFDLQTTHNSYDYPSLLTVGLRLGYQLDHSNIIGVGASYELGTGNGIQHIAFSSQGLGLRSFLQVKVHGSFSVTGGFEYNYTVPFSSYQDLKQLQYWTRSGLIGVTKTISTKSKLLKQTTLSLLWDFLSYSQQPPTPAFLFRVGYNL
jgi:hypothetical protein